jgi:glycosyltransferase involved in cell wall biosynthesis
VYDGQWGKINDFTSSVPPSLIDEIVRPAVSRGERVLIMAEDWQTVGALYGLDAHLRYDNLRQHVDIAWNANNTYGFNEIDFSRLRNVAHITAVSRYMKFEIALHGAEALVIPNGIPERIWTEVRDADIAYLRRVLAERRMLLKVGRFDPDKRWMQAIDAVANLKDDGAAVQLVVRGGKEGYAYDVFARAIERGLEIDDVALQDPTLEAVSDALAGSRADIINIRSFVPDNILFTLYGAVDAVLANSGKEPFGLVGLEVMAAGGIAVCGSTGEDYAQAFDNAIVCDTGDPRELSTYIQRLWEDAALREHIRTNAAHTARQFSWPNVLDVLDAKVAYFR